MIQKDKIVAIKNKYGGMVGYKVEELGINRKFYPNETKEVTFEELQRLSFTPGGDTILTDFLQIDDEEVIEQLFHKKPEMEYFYSREDIKKLMESGSLDQFLDCLDFAPAGVKDIIKDMAVELPLNDMNKRQAIMEKLNFDTVILGGGPAGFSAGIYAARGAVSTAIVDISMLGGQPSNYLELD